MTSLDALLDELTSGDDEKAEAAAQSLWSFGSQALQALRGLLTTPDPDARWWAVRALAVIPDPAVTGILQASLRDPDLAVRQCAALALRDRPDPGSIPELIATIQEPDRILAHLSADALGAIGAPAVPALLDVLESGPQTARLEAIRALARMGDKRAIPALFSALDEGSALMEYWAEIGLARLDVGMVFYR